MDRPFPSNAQTHDPVLANTSEICIAFRTPTSVEHGNGYDWFHDLEHRGNGTFDHTSEGVCMAYKVDEGPVHEVLSRVRTDVPDMYESEWDDDATKKMREFQFKAHWERFRDHLSKKGVEALFFYDVVYVDVPIPILLQIWDDWKRPELGWDSDYDEYHPGYRDYWGRNELW